MDKASGKTGGGFIIFQEGPITWMAPRGIGGGWQAPPGPPLPRPMVPTKLETSDCI